MQRKRKKPEAMKRHTAPEREELPAIRIFCEGNNEKHYIDGFRIEHLRNVVRERIVITCGDGDPSMMLQKAIEAKRSGPFDFAFIVFDRDIHEHFDRTVKDCRENHSTKIFACWTNPCLEFWFLLHYDYCSRSMERDEALAELKKHIADYCKTYPKIWKILSGELPTAKENARKLAKWLADNDKGSSDCPSTRFHDLLDMIKEKITPKQT